MQDILHNYPGLDIMAGSVFDLVLDQSNAEHERWAKVIGVKLGQIACFSYYNGIHE
jgi:tRNA uridine 5-carboxymethylaminomethyl modification enzyme